MRLSFSRVLFGAALGVLPSIPAMGSVFLSASPTTAVTTPGGSVTFTLDLNITAGEQVNSVNYFLASPSNNIFSITSRSTAGNQITGNNLFLQSDAAGNGAIDVTDSASTFKDIAGDLGGSTATPSTALTGTQVVLGTYTLSVAGTSGHNYTLTDFETGGLGWSNTANGEFAYSQPLSYSVSVAVPEPASLTLVGGSVAALMLRRRRRTA